MSDADRIFFVEQMDNTVARITEVVMSLKEDIVWMKPLVAEIPGIKADIATMQFAITDTNKELRKTNQDLATNNRKLEKNTQDLAKNNKRLDIVTQQLSATTREMRRKNDAYDKKFAKLERV